MIFIASKNIWTPSPRFGRPKFQKGILHPVGFWGPDSGPVVSLSDVDVIRGPVDLATVYAGVTYNGTGAEFSNNTDGTQSYSVSRGNWLVSGAASAVWMAWSQGGGDSLNTTPATTPPRLQMNTARLFEITDTTILGGARSNTLTVTMYDASTGGNVLDSTTITLSAEKESGA